MDSPALWNFNGSVVILVTKPNQTLVTKPVATAFQHNKWISVALFTWMTGFKLITMQNYSDFNQISL